MKRTHR